MLEFLANNPLLALAVIMAAGLAIGKVKVFGLSLGAAAAMFVALGLSTANPDISLPPLVYQLGLALFVYTIGLAFGASFFRDFRSRGWKLTLLIIAMLALLVGLAYVIIRAVGLDGATAAGMFAGSLSSTPGMAAVVDMVGNATPVVGYSLAYPGAVIGAIVVAAVGAAVLKVNHRADAEAEGMLPAPLVWKGVRVTKDIRRPIGELHEITGEKVVATRLIKGATAHDLADPARIIQVGEEYLINGTEEATTAAIAQIGEEIQVGLSEDAGLLYTRVTVSSPKIAGRRVREINALDNGFIIARIRKGDSDIVPLPDTILEYSDRVRVVTAPGNLPAVKKYLGNSESALGNADLLPMSLGITLGLLLGAIPIPMPGGAVLQFGFGGGPIIAGLILGYVGRSGPINWQMPFHTRQSMSTLGLVLFLAGVGTSAGAAFRNALSDPASLMYIGVGLIITLASAIGLGIACMVLFKLKWDEAMGVSAGMTTNPAVFSYIQTQTGTDLAGRGYATVYPTTIIGKIVASQMLLLLLV